MSTPFGPSRRRPVNAHAPPACARHGPGSIFGNASPLTAARGLPMSAFCSASRIAHVGFLRRRGLWLLRPRRPVGLGRASIVGRRAPEGTQPKDANARHDAARATCLASAYERIGRVIGIEVSNGG